MVDNLRQMTDHPCFKMGVTLEVFQSFRSFDCSRDLLKMEVIAGVMALAVARSIWHETPSDPEAV